MVARQSLPTPSSQGPRDKPKLDSTKVLHGNLEFIRLTYNGQEALGRSVGDRIATIVEDWNPARMMVSPQLHRGRLPNPQPILAYILQLLSETLRPCAVRAELHTTGWEGPLHPFLL